MEDHSSLATSDWRATQFLASAISFNRVLPANVFLGKWDGFYFFESNRVLGLNKILPVLRRETRFVSVLLANMKHTADGTGVEPTNESSTFLLHHEDDAGAFLTVFRSDVESQVGVWVLVSEQENWAIYIDYMAEIGIFSHRNLTPEQTLRCREALGAFPLELLCSGGPEYELDPYSSADFLWEEDLKRNYVT